MNLLEHYILNDYVDCYGSKSHVVKLLTKDDWIKIKKQGYYMA